jgi:hypothetical protein
MASEILGLFTTPEQYQLAQQEAQQAQAARYAQLDPMARANYGVYRAGQQLANTIGGALGGEDPQLKLISQRQQLASQLDQNNPDSYMMVAEQARRGGDPQFAMAISDAYRQLQTGAATLKKTNLEAQKAELSIQQEKDFRDELSKLVNPTEEDILRVATKYGSSDKVLSVIQAAITKAADRQIRLDIEREKIEARASEKLKDIEYKKERDLQNAKDEKERAQIRAEAQLQVAQIMTDSREAMTKLMVDSRESMAKLSSSLRQPPAPSVTTIVDPTNPSQMISIDARQYKGGGIGSVGVIGVSGKESSAAVKENKATEGKDQLQNQLDDLRGAFTSLNEKKAITSTERGAVSNVLSYVQGSGVGQIGGKVLGTKEQKERNLINSSKQRISQAIKNATGMSSQQLNSNFELKSMLDSLSDVSLGYEASMEIIDRLERDYVKGGGMNKETPPKKTLSAEDQKALNWANSNPNDPRSARIKSSLGVK